jgi:DNA repair photolyase
MSPRWRPEPLALGSATDPYQPVERKLQITRRCLEVLTEFRQPVTVVTKNLLVTRDLDLLSALAEVQAASVLISLTTLDPALRRAMEPRTSPPAARLDAIRRLKAAGIPVGVLMSPVIPGLTDHEMPQLLKAAAEAGARWAGYVPLRLPHAVEVLFIDWLERHYPLRRDKVLNRLRDLRGGQLHDARFGTRMTGTGPWADRLDHLFDVSCRRAGLTTHGPTLSTAAFRRPPGAQLELFPPVLSAQPPASHQP